MQKLLTEIHASLGITEKYLRANRLSLHEQPRLEDLRVVDIDFEGKPFLLISRAAEAWFKMREAARKDQVLLMPFSGFRSYLHQKNLIKRRLESGRELEQILTHVAIPGFSEHHSGRAVDIHAEGKAFLDETFEERDEFAWLTKHAKQFGFTLSYPRDNTQGIVYEPWHWLFS